MEASMKRHVKLRFAAAAAFIFLTAYFIYKTAVYQAPSRAALTSDEASCRVCYLLTVHRNGKSI